MLIYDEEFSLSNTAIVSDGKKSPRPAGTEGTWGGPSSQGGRSIYSRLVKFYAFG